MRKDYYRIGALALAACMLASCASVTDPDAQDADVLSEQQTEGAFGTTGTVSDQEGGTGEIKMDKDSEIKDNEIKDDGIKDDESRERDQQIRLFGYRLFDVASGGQAQNPVLSPVSAYLALSMAGAGASGATRDEFCDVLGADMVSLSGQLMDDLPLSMANAAWIDERFLVTDEWIGTIRSEMGAEAFQARLSSKDAMESMDRWVSEKTNGLVEKMIEEPLMPDTRLVLFSTLYFKADWRVPFERDQTYEEDFQLSDGTKVMTEMMHRSGGRMDYISDEHLEGVVLPYSGPGDLAFIALKPRNGMIWDMRADLDSETIAGLLSGRQVRTVDLKLPKFAVTFDMRLNEALQAMGLNKCFSVEEADLSGLGKTIDGDSLYIDLVRQKARIIVDEKGTEAAAATEVEMKDRGALIVRDATEVFFDRPFFYIIMDMDKEIPLFIGLMEDPSIS